MKAVPPSKKRLCGTHAPPPAMMVRPLKSYTPWITSSSWAGGKPEMERPLGDIFQGMVFGITYPRNTNDAIVAKILRNNYIILATLSLIMTVGVMLSYRNHS